jgi:thiol peroxidase
MRRPLAVGAKLPWCRLYRTNGRPFYTTEISGWAVLDILPVISAGVCDRDLMAFNKTITRNKHVTLYTIAISAPEILANWCGWLARGNMILLADASGDFGRKTGLLIPDNQTLVRSIYIIDPTHHVAYRQIVPEQTELPDFAAAAEWLMGND